MAKQLPSGRMVPSRVRNELRFRSLTVAAKQQITDKFWRITFSGTDLKGFNSPGTDDHIKCFFSQDPQYSLIPTLSDEGIVWPNNQRPQSRDYTPLAFNGKDSLTIDFFRHEGGVASQWAEQVKLGDPLVIGGPRGSLIIPTDYQQQLYILDETGLPALKRRLAQLEEVEATLIIFADKALVDTYLGPLKSGVTLHCLAESKMDEQGVEHCIRLADKLDFPPDDHFIWLTGEGHAVKQLADYFINQRACLSELVRAVAYWHVKESE